MYLNAKTTCIQLNFWPRGMDKSIVNYSFRPTPISVVEGAGVTYSLNA